MQPQKDIPTLEKIAMIVQRYQAIPADCRDIEKVTTWQRKLACALFDYAGEVGSLYKASNGAEYARKSAFEKERLRLIGEGKSAAAAGNEAQATIDSLIFDEVCADADYRAAQMQYQAATDVLRSMIQFVASMKEERRIEMQGQAQGT